MNPFKRLFRKAEPIVAVETPMVAVETPKVTISYLSLDDLGLELTEMPEFSTCQLSIMGSVDMDVLRRAVLHTHLNLDDMKMQMVYRRYYKLAYIDANKAADFESFVSGLRLSSVHIWENRNIEILVDNDEYYCGHYITGLFSPSWEYLGSYDC